MGSNRTEEETIDAIVKTNIRTLVGFFAAGIMAVVVIQGCFLSYQAHKAACDVVTSKGSQFTGSIARELMLGEAQPAKVLFGQFRNSISSLGVVSDFELQQVTSSSAEPVCNPHLLYAQAALPVRFAGKSLGIINGTVRYVPSGSLLLTLAAVLLLSFATMTLLVERISRTLERTLVEPIKLLSTKRKLPVDRVIAKEVREVAKNLSAMEESLIREQQKAAEINQLRALNVLATRVAHDIRSPLSALKVAAEMLPKELGEHSALLSKAAQRIAAIADDLIHNERQVYARSTRSESSVPQKLISLNELLDEITKEKTLEYSHLKEVVIAHDRANEDVLIDADAQDISRVISNLINNSVESFSKRGLVTVTSRRNSDSDVVIVRDDGSGIPDSLLGKLGKVRLSVGKQSTRSGSGIGMVHAAETVAKFGGRIKVNSKLGLGTEVTLSFPRRPRLSSQS